MCASKFLRNSLVYLQLYARQRIFNLTYLEQIISWIWKVPENWEAIQNRLRSPVKTAPRYVIASIYFIVAPHKPFVIKVSDCICHAKTHNPIFKKIRFLNHHQYEQITQFEIQLNDLLTSWHFLKELSKRNGVGVRFSWHSRTFDLLPNHFRDVNKIIEATPKMISQLQTSHSAKESEL